MVFSTYQGWRQFVQLANALDQVVEAYRRMVAQVRATCSATS
jgi:hypothetical protein